MGLGIDHSASRPANTGTCVVEILDTRVISSSLSASVSSGRSAAIGIFRTVFNEGMAFDNPVLPILGLYHVQHLIFLSTHMMPYTYFLVHIVKSQVII